MCGLNSEEDLMQTLVILSFPYYHQTHQFLDILLKIGRIGKVWTIERQVEHWINWKGLPMSRVTDRHYFWIASGRCCSIDQLKCEI